MKNERYASFLRMMLAAAFGLVILDFVFCITPCKAAKVIPVNRNESIQSVINNAVSGDTVMVFPGTYFENIRLKSGVTLRSKEGAEVTFINGSNGTAPVVTMAADSTLNGFTILGRKVPGGKPEVTDTGHDAEGKGAVSCINLSGTITNNIIRNNQTSGISISGEQASPMVSGNKVFLNKGAGIGCNKKSSPTITENDVHENDMAGIGIQNGSAPLVVDNKCYKNKMSGIGIRHKTSSPIIRSNKCYQNLFSGIGVELGAQPSIEDNEIFENNKAGIGIKDPSIVSVTGNKLYKNTLSGIGIRGHATVSINKNELYENILAGITVMNESNVTITENNINDNGTTGVVVNNSKVTIKKNEVFLNTHHGISIHRGSRGDIAENKIHNNGKDDKRGAGVLIVSSNLMVIKNNLFSNNYGPGVYTHHCSPYVIENTFINDEVLAKKHAAPIVSRNVFYGRGKNGKRGKSGVAARIHSFPLVIRNEFLGRFGVGSYKASSPVIIDNLFSGTDESSIDTGRSGVKIVGDATAIVINNRFLNGNKVSCRGLKLTENPKIASYDRAFVLSMIESTLGLTKEVLENKDVRAEIKRVARKQRRYKAKRALSGKARKLKGVVIQDNLFLTQ